MSSDLRKQINNIVEDYSACLTLAKTLTTSDAYEETTAEAADLIEGKTAYSRGIKLTGTYIPLNTSDADATAEDIMENKVAYVNDERIVGTYVPLDTSDATATSTNLDSGVIAYTKDDTRISGSYPILDTNTKPRMLKLNKRSNYNDSYGEIISTKKTIFMVNGQSVYGEFGEIIEVPVSSLPVDITDKSIVLRFIYDNWPYSLERMRCSILELYVAPKGSRFQTRRDSGEDIMWCHNSSLSRINFDVYRIYRSGATPFEDFDLTTWESKGSKYYYSSGKCDKSWWVYATEDTYSGGGSGLTYGTKITGFGDGCILKMTGGTDTSTRFPKLKNGGVCYMKLDNEAIAKAIGLTADMIAKGQTVLGIIGTYEGETSTVTEE